MKVPQKEKLIAIGLTILAIVALCSCKKEDDPCWTCRTEIYLNGERLESTKDNLYCNMDFENAYYLERTNEVEFQRDTIHIRTDVKCRALVR
jgi:hypothetical protein